jgi:hypothetical protein
MRPEHGQFCLVRITARNLATREQRWSVGWVYGYTDEDAKEEISQSQQAVYALNKDLGVADIPAGESWTGTAVFDMGTDEDLYFLVLPAVRNGDVAFVEL